MKNSHIFFYILFFIPFLLESCNTEDPNITPEYECEINIENIDFTFTIDYENPDFYLNPGNQSDLDSVHLNTIIEVLGSPGQDIDYIRKLCIWVNNSFSWVNAGGDMIGVPTANDLMESMELYGCHSAALLISSILRKCGYPATMIETASVNWAYNYWDGKTNNFVGHVMSEIYVNNKWILLDNNGHYVPEYDPTNPYIPTDNPQVRKLFVLAKGLDTWDYYEKSNSDTHSLMIEFSDNVHCYEDFFNSTTYSWTY